jgi:hypothetical protein
MVLPNALTEALAAAPPTAPKLTMLSDMAGDDFELVAQRHAALGLQWLDLKNGLYGGTINNLSIENTRKLADVAARYSLRVSCLSSALCASELSLGRDHFRQRHGDALTQMLRRAEILKPRAIRLTSAFIRPYPDPNKIMDIVERDYPWVFEAYAELVDRIHAAGYVVLIENEPLDIILARPEGIVRFFQRLDRPSVAKYTWDVQNLWYAGVFPTMEVYRQLKPLIGCIHVKGGRTDGSSDALVHASSLEDASWNVREIVKAVVDDGVSPIICLNSSLGKKPPGFDVWNVAQQDVAYLRKQISADL